MEYGLRLGALSCRLWAGLVLRVNPALESYETSTLNPKLSEPGAVEQAERDEASILSPKLSGGQQSSQSHRQLWAARYARQAAGE